MNQMVLSKIRENERKSHTEVYTNAVLYEFGSWLQQPVRSVLEIFPYFKGYERLDVLDLGCGVGRNSIAIAQHFQNIPCLIDCVDILDLAAEKLTENAQKFHVADSIRPIVKPIEEFRIAENSYDWIIAVSALEHVDSEGSLIQKLSEIRDGLRKNGILCLILNSSIRERCKATGEAIPAQFEVNLSTDRLYSLLERMFSNWEILKSSIREQHYDIPRDAGICELRSNVVTYVARK